MKDRGTRTWGWALGLSVVLALLIGVASAKKPPKPPPEPPAPADTGLIYWGGLRTMETDGTDKQLVDGVPALTWDSHVWKPSQVLHDGVRWFLEFREISDPAWALYELWAVPATGTGAFQLTFDDDVRANFAQGYEQYPTDCYRAHLKWAAHDDVVDGKVSYLALRYDENGDPVDYGVREVYIDWANKEATAAASMIPVGPYKYVSATGIYWLRVEYDWNPAGTSIVYWSSDQGGALRRIDEADDWSPTVLTWYGGRDPQWSTDGTLIAFTTGAYTDRYGRTMTNIETIGADGSGQGILVAATTKLSAYNPRWSPSGSHLAYNLFKAGKQLTYTLDIYRITKTGGDSTNLTDDGTWKLAVVDWRDE